ncbi:MAG: DUF202 domain-containing protein [Nanoarchaeota archaeon]
MKGKRKKKISLQEKQVIFTKQQTVLSKERTILSFMRTGLTFIAVGVAILNFLTQTIYHIIGWSLIIIGFIEVIESYRRLSKQGKSMKKIKKELGEN